MAKKSFIPAVDLPADDDNIEDKEDVVMTTTARTQTFVRWTRDEEKLLCEVWVGVSENNDIGNDRNEKCFWGQIHDDFNKSTNDVSRISDFITEGVSGSFSDHVPGVATSAPTEAPLASPPAPPTADAPGMTPAMTTSILYAPGDAPTSTTPNAENLNKVGGGDVVILALGVAENLNKVPLVMVRRER
ncbi:hypothetical protein Tco_1543484 [Tanacetum coccineum]